MEIPHPIAGSYPLRAGNAVRPLIDGEATFRRIAEAIDAARQSVWLTVAFYAPDFRMPDGRGSLFDVLDRAVARRLDVRVIYWRPNPESSWLGRTFSGSSADRTMLQARGSQFRARWDRAHGPYLHHQKSWLVDAGGCLKIETTRHVTTGAGYRNSRNLCRKHTQALTLPFWSRSSEQARLNWACNRSTILYAPSGICQLPLTLNSTRQFAGCEGCGIRGMTETPAMWSYSGCSRISLTTKATNSAAVFVSMHLSRLSYPQSSALSSSCALQWLSCISTTPLPSPGP